MIQVRSMPLTRRRLLLASLSLPAFAAGDFWNRKPPSQWSGDEVDRLLSDSPWAHAVDVEITPDGDKPRTAQDVKGSSGKREFVTVRWMSAAPIVEALHTPMPKSMEGRYAFTVTNLSANAIPRGKARNEDPVEQMKDTATLRVKGQEPIMAGAVEPVHGSTNGYWIGFERDLLPLRPADREIVFSVKAGILLIQAKFDTRQMMYRGKLAV